MFEQLLEKRDYTVIVAKTAIGLAQPSPGSASRWEAAHTAILALAQACQALDPDGITLYISSADAAPNPFKCYRQVTSDKLQQIFSDHYPPDTLNLLDGLQAAMDDYFVRKAAGQTKPNGEIMVVLIDGEPSDRMAIVRAIVHTTQKMDRDQELGIGFAQIGDDSIARGFLEALDHDLRSTAGAKFDIVHTRVLDEISTACLTDFLAHIIQD